MSGALRLRPERKEMVEAMADKATIEEVGNTRLSPHGLFHTHTHHTDTHTPAHTHTAALPPSGYPPPNSCGVLTPVSPSRPPTAARPPG
jgi:hypothetical protein